MASKTLIDGTAYNIIGGSTLVDGTGYKIASGNTLIDGTSYSIPFVSSPSKKLDWETSTYDQEWVEDLMDIVNNSSQEELAELAPIGAKKKDFVVVGHWIDGDHTITCQYTQPFTVRHYFFVTSGFVSGKDYIETTSGTTRVNIKMSDYLKLLAPYAKVWDGSNLQLNSDKLFRRPPKKWLYNDTSPYPYFQQAEKLSDTWYGGGSGTYKVRTAECERVTVGGHSYYYLYGIDRSNCSYGYNTLDAEKASSRTMSEAPFFILGT